MSENKAGLLVPIVVCGALVVWEVAETCQRGWYVIAVAEALILGYGLWMALWHWGKLR